MTGDAPTERSEPRPESYLTWEEARRLLAFREGGSAKSPPEGRPLVSRYVWSAGVLVDVTCGGCGSSGCNRCSGRGAVAEASQHSGGELPSGSAERGLPAALRRLRAALGLPGGRAR